MCSDHLVEEKIYHCKIIFKISLDVHEYNIKPAGGPGMNQITAKKIWVYFITIYTMRRTDNKNGSF